MCISGRDRRKTAAAAVVVALLLGGGCMPDLGPDFIPMITAFGIVAQSPSYSALYSDAPSLTEPLLPGEWIVIGNQADWLFEEAAEDGYRLTVTRSGDSAVLHGKILQLGAHRFVDLQIIDPPLSSTTDPPFEIHGVFQFAIRNDRLRLAGLSQTWLRETLERGDYAISHQTLEMELIILDAPTDELRAFFLYAATDPDAFPDPNRSGRGFDLLRRTQK